MQAWAVVENGKPLEALEIPKPEPTGSQVLLEVAHCGVCHSDLHLWEGHYALGGDRRMLLKDRGVTLPLVMGHEIVGRVVQAGPDATDVRIGDLKIVYPWLGCGTCAICRAENDNMCLTPRSIGVFQNGGYATHVIVPEPRHLIDIGALPPRIAATYACSGLTAYAAVKKALPLPPEEPIVVIGIGGLGLYAVAILRALGHRKIVAIDLKRENRAAAEAAGASDVVDANDAALAQAMIAAAGGGIAVAIDFVNDSTTARAAFDALRRGGKLVQVGFFGGELNVPLPLMPLRALTIVGSYVGSPADLRELVELGSTGRLPPIPLRTAPQSSVNDVLRELRDGRVTGRVVLDAESAAERAGAPSSGHSRQRRKRI
jgi:alcohol dehydrogenase/propanol-preferring alcohol dehydrogenase